jgi:hypothetical protein
MLKNLRDLVKGNCYMRFLAIFSGVGLFASLSFLLIAIFTNGADWTSAIANISMSISGIFAIVLGVLALFYLSEQQAKIESAEYEITKSLLKSVARLKILMIQILHAKVIHKETKGRLEHNLPDGDIKVKAIAEQDAFFEQRCQKLSDEIFNEFISESGLALYYVLISLEGDNKDLMTKIAFMLYSKSMEINIDFSIDFLQLLDALNFKEMQETLTDNHKVYDKAVVRDAMIKLVHDSSDSHKV